MIQGISFRRVCAGLALGLTLTACLSQRPVEVSPSAPIEPVDLPFGPALKARVIDEIGRVLESKAYAGSIGLEGWPRRAHEAREALDQADTPESFARALNSALRGMGASHLGVLSASDQAALKNGLRYGFNSHALPEGALVVDVLDGSEAERSGLRRGDLITLVDGLPFDPRRLVTCAKAQGPVTFRGLRGGRPATWVIGCAPVRPKTPPTLSWADEGVALLRVPSFDRSAYAAPLIQGYFSRIAKASGLILDLRGNSGGDFLSYRHLATHLWGRGNKVLGYTVNWAQVQQAGGQERRPEKAATRAGTVLDFVGMRGPDRFSGPIVVLVDAWTASAAELCAGALQDHRRASLIGTRTAGALLGVMRDGQGEWGCALSGGFRLLYPVEVLLTPKLRALEGSGVTPDQVLDIRATADDTQIIPAALEVLRQARGAT